MKEQKAKEEQSLKNEIKQLKKDFTTQEKSNKDKIRTIKSNYKQKLTKSDK